MPKVEVFVVLTLEYRLQAARHGGFLAAGTRLKRHRCSSTWPLAPYYCFLIYNHRRKQGDVVGHLCCFPEAKGLVMFAKPTLQG